MFVKNHENYEDLYKEGDVLIYTPHYDGQALVSAEAMAAGLPVITIDAAPMNEHWTIYEGMPASGLLLQAERTSNAQTINPRSVRHHVDEKYLAMAIDAMKYAPIKEISTSNRVIAEKCFSWDACLTFYRHYLEVIWDT